MTNNCKHLNIIGAGKVGRVLGRLWAEQGTFRIQDVLNRSAASSLEAVRFIGASRPVAAPENLRPAEYHLIATGDDDLAACAADLATCGILRPGDIVFHCSGFLASTVLNPLAASGALTASLHPLRSFADPMAAAEGFAGTNCALEGTPAALAGLRPAVAAVGGVPFTIDAAQKAIYHAAAVLSSNGLAALLQVAVDAWAKAGLTEEQALRISEPLVRNTVDNIFRMGPTEALTGPVVRGDWKVVAGEMAALGDWQPGHQELYRVLGRAALEMTRRRRTLGPEQLTMLEHLLAGNPERPES
jgi:predicted short-subunit dehydrogenase-like oxidoreductase (DUF2520 family)